MIDRETMLLTKLIAPLLLKAIEVLVEATVKVTCVAHLRPEDIPEMVSVFLDYSRCSPNSCEMIKILNSSKNNSNSHSEMMRNIVLGVRDRTEELLGVRDES
jgi:hypothetical protein